MCAEKVSSQNTRYNETYAPWLSDRVLDAFAQHSQCRETRGWPQILQERRNTQNQADRYKSGGLGELAVKGQFGIWVCWPNHPCLGAVGAGPGDRMCYVRNDVTEKWHPWGLNSVLKLCSGGR